MAVPYIFAASTSAIPLANLDTNFAYFANAITVNATSNAMTIASSGQVTFTPISGAVAFRANGNMQLSRTTNIPVFTITSNAASGYYPPQMQFFRANASGGATPDFSTLGEIRFDGLNSAGSYDNGAFIYVTSGVNATAGMPTTMAFGTASSGANATERMAISNTGDIGINTPAYLGQRLRVNQTSGLFDVSYPIQSWSYANYRAMDFFIDGNVSPVFNSDPDSYWNPDTAYIWKFRNSELMRLKRSGTPAGALGIGTTSPGNYGEKLAVASGGSQQASIFILNPGIGSAQIGFTANSSNLRIRNSYTDGTITNGLGIDIGISGILYTVPTYNNTTGSGANVVVGADGQLYRSTSSLKYKTDVQDSVHGLDEVMKLRPVTYKGINDGNTVFGGLIAEEVDAAGLAEFVQYADDGTPDALAYGNMVSLLVKAVQQLKAEIDSLKA